jgi:transposase
LQRSGVKWAPSSGICQIHRRVAAHSVSALEHRQGAGRPEVAKSITKARILRELRRDPLKLGYNTTVWTVALCLNQVYQCQITERTLRRRMKEIGLVWKRPRYIFVTKDPHRAQKKGRLSDREGRCPETPRRIGVQARPETPHRATRQTLKPGASFSQGVRWILRV